MPSLSKSRLKGPGESRAAPGGGHSASSSSGAARSGTNALQSNPPAAAPPGALQELLRTREELRQRAGNTSIGDRGSCSMRSSAGDGTSSSVSGLGGGQGSIGGVSSASGGGPNLLDFGLRQGIACGASGAPSSARLCSGDEGASSGQELGSQIKDTRLLSGLQSAKARQVDMPVDALLDRAEIVELFGSAEPQIDGAGGLSPGEIADRFRIVLQDRRHKQRRLEEVEAKLSHLEQQNVDLAMENFKLRAKESTASAPGVGARRLLEPSELHAVHSLVQPVEVSLEGASVTSTAATAPRPWQALVPSRSTTPAPVAVQWRSACPAATMPASACTATTMPASAMTLRNSPSTTNTGAVPGPMVKAPVRMVATRGRSESPGGRSAWAATICPPGQAPVKVIEQKAQSPPISPRHPCKVAAAPVPAPIAKLRDPVIAAAPSAVGPAYPWVLPYNPACMAGASLAQVPAAASSAAAPPGQIAPSSVRVVSSITAPAAQPVL